MQCFHCDFASADLNYMERTHLVILDWPICNFSNSHHLGKDILHVSAKYWQCRFLNELPSPTLPSKLQLQIQSTVVNFDYLLSKISLLQCSIIKTAGAEWILCCIKELFWLQIWEAVRWLQKMGVILLEIFEKGYFGKMTL